MRVLFVCTGNICRSPMACGYFVRRAGDAALQRWSAESAGLAAPEGAPASPLAVEVAEEFGVDLSGHRARRVDRGMIAAADLVLVMEPFQLHQARALWPPVAGRCRLLGEYDPAAPELAIEDPIGKDPDTYRSVFARIAAAVDGLARQIAAADP